ncbi:M23 family metallopeptidase [Geoalkalibacter halelectricus]|uniref:M23 family metallopeptidase n=1 Tax=Geoalkalibacter halelectricus TaxID=2847045 RepID=A0ABY5ZRQ9_9BACT|nr:M23 family metallopeptidase [Geoalkalibacter halelectricus]MDO3379918.1 M23 family metallopeptidase [Geoalkalibacter halelectricus]UWZ80555.1 M23 family metallopeptidase [Geoalkalibacter halelectricus]
MRSYSRKKSLAPKLGLLLSILVAVALIVGAFSYFRDTDGPQITLMAESERVSAKPLTFELSDKGSGLRNATITLTQGNISRTILDTTYEPGVTRSSETIALQDPALRDGPIEVRVIATDRSIYRFGAGNTSDQVFHLIFDATPPRINVLSTAHNINQGGAALIVYTVSEEVKRTGMEVGDYFFPGFRQPSGEYLALFALPHDMSPAEFSPRLIAVDLAGNEGRGGFSHHANARRFRHDNLNISDNFLNAVMPQFERYFPNADSLLETFLKVNTQMREDNRQTLNELSRNTASEPLWRGDFLRMAGAANMAGYADRRTYLYQGRKISEATHMGIDLASVQQAPIHASNHGRVIFAEFLGIYGNCVVIDHGLGLQSLYAHLTRMEVSPGDFVQKGDLIGNSGATGMALGDHLHFEIMVGGVPVNPIEWWDPNWVRNNITSKLPSAP